MVNDFATVARLIADFEEKLKVIVERDGRRHMMDAHIDFHTMAAIEDELLPALELVLTCIDYEPCDEEMGGEPPVTMAELHSAAHAQHTAFHN